MQEQEIIENKKGNSALGIISFVLSIVAIATICCFYISGILGFVAIILGILALVLYKEKNKVFPILGISLGGVAVLVAIALFLLNLAGMIARPSSTTSSSSLSTSGPTSPSVSNSSSTTTSNSSSTTKRSISEVVRFGRKGVKINSADGAEVGINMEKVTKKDIKYIYSTAYFYNAVGDLVECEVSRKSSKDVSFTGPMDDDSIYTFYRDTIAWNKTIDSVVFTDFEVVYMDGTSEKCSGKVTATKDDDNYFKMK